MSQREAILAAIPEFPGLPTAATRVLRLLQDPESGIAEIMAVLESDPALTLEVLRLANSAYFAGPRAIGSLRDAGVLLGASRLTQIVLASAIFPVARPPLRGYDLPSGKLLQHFVATAIGVEELARELQITLPPHAFTAGLLSDIGKIVLGTFVEVDVKPIQALAASESLSFEIAEQRVLGLDHAEAGAVLLGAWGLPDDVVDVVRYHHRPDDFPGDRRVVDLVHISDLLSIEAGLGVGVDGLAYRPAPGALERLGIKRRILESVCVRILTKMEDLLAHVGG